MAISRVQIKKVKRPKMNQKKTVGPPRDRTPNDPLTSEEVTRLIMGTSDLMDRTIFTVGFLTGMRVGEIANLDESKVDLRLATAEIWDQKKREMRTIYLQDQAVSAIRLYLSVFPMNKRGTPRLFPISTKGIERRIQGWGQKVIGKRRSWHTVRHTYISLSRENDIPMEVVIANTGDTPRTILTYYSKFSAKRVLHFLNERPIFTLEDLKQNVEKPWRER